MKKLLIFLLLFASVFSFGQKISNLEAQKAELSNSDVTTFVTGTGTQKVRADSLCDYASRRIGIPGMRDSLIADGHAIINLTGDLNSKVPYKLAALWISQAGTSNPTDSIIYDGIGIDSIKRTGPGITRFYTNLKLTYGRTAMVVAENIDGYVKAFMIPQSGSLKSKAIDLHTQVETISLDIQQDESQVITTATADPSWDESDDVLNRTLVLIFVFN
jgi:hypothetical protein